MGPPKLKEKKIVHVVPNRSVLFWDDARFLKGVEVGEVQKEELKM